MMLMMLALGGVAGTSQCANKTTERSKYVLWAVSQAAKKEALTAPALHDKHAKRFVYITRAELSKLRIKKYILAKTWSAGAAEIPHLGQISSAI